MQSMSSGARDREKVLGELRGMPEFLRRAFASLSPSEATKPGDDDTFSPVEHCWHLADLEREGYGVRIERLREEREPELPDFDGARAALERNYRALSMEQGLAAFAEARRRNIAVFESLADSEWSRSGTQEGVGPVSLCDIPRMMAEHDATHRREIEVWLAGR